MAAACWFLTVGLIATVDLGWECSLAWAARFQPGSEMARPITTMVLGIAALSLGLALFIRRAWSRTGTRLIGLLVVFLALVALGEHVTRFENGISRFTFDTIFESPPPGLTPWMAPNASLCLALIGLALFYLPSRTRRGIVASQWLALFSLLPASLALLGYAFHVKPLFLIGKHTALALPTALGITALASGIIGVHVKRGPFAPLVSLSLGGYVLRRLLPAVAFVPVALGWLRLQGQYADLYTLEFGVALFTAANTLVFISLVLGVARRMIRLEERFSVVSRITNDAIWDWNLRSNDLWWNEGAEKLFGLAPHAVPRTIAAWEERIHPDDRERVSRSVRAVIDGGLREWAGEYRFLASDGSDRIVLDRGEVIRDERGRPARMLGGMTDITERRRSEEALLFAVRRFEALANLIPQIIWSTTPDGYHDYFNDRWYEFTGMPRGENQGWNWKNYLHPDDVARSVSLWEECLHTGKPYEVEYRFRRARDGAYVWFIGRAVPIRDAEGRISRWFGTCTDIEHQVREGDRLEALVHERTTRLRESIADLEHFSYTLTHDMRAPLRAMQGFAQLLLEEHAGRLDPEGVEYLQRIVTAAQRMDHLILDALNYSKVVKAELPLDIVETGPLLHSLIETYPEFQPPRAQIDVADPLPAVLGNVSGLTQCFSNLLGNAVKFVTPGAQPRVRIWAENRGDHVRLCFEDNGIGIAPSHREKIFMMFERLDPAYEGTGVGLALVRKVVERMHGRLGVDGAPGGGSRFWIELPKG